MSELLGSTGMVITQAYLVWLAGIHLLLTYRTLECSGREREVYETTAYEEYIIMQTVVHV